MDTHAAGGPALGHEHPAPHLARRRRRSASALPPHPSPADIPDDASGRVAFLVVGDAADVIPDAGALAAGEETAPAVDAPRPLHANPFDEWRPVMILAGAMMVIFVIGLIATR